MAKPSPPPALFLCLSREDTRARSGLPWETAEGFCSVCDRVVAYDADLYRLAQRKHGRRGVQRICLGCAENRLRAGEKPEVDFEFTAEYLRRRLRQ